MARIIVFGAGGRVGRAVVDQAVTGGHEVTAVMRDPGRHEAWRSAAVTPRAGDVTAADDVDRLVAGHDAVVSAVARLDLPAGELFVPAARNLAAALSGTSARLVLVGIGTVLRTADGTPFHDAAGLPESAREFSLGHQAALDLLRRGGAGVDWLVLAPPPVMLAEAPGPGPVLVGSDLVPDAAALARGFSYHEVALGVLSEIEAPTRHRELAGLSRAATN